MGWFFFMNGARLDEWMEENIIMKQGLRQACVTRREKSSLGGGYVGAANFVPKFSFLQPILSQKRRILFQETGLRLGRRILFEYVSKIRFFSRNLTLFQKYESIFPKLRLLPKNRATLISFHGQHKTLILSDS